MPCSTLGSMCWLFILHEVFILCLKLRNKEFLFYRCMGLYQVAHASSLFDNNKSLFTISYIIIIHIQLWPNSSNQYGLNKELSRSCSSRDPSLIKFLIVKDRQTNKKDCKTQIPMCDSCISSFFANAERGFHSMVVRFNGIGMVLVPDFSSSVIFIYIF